MNDYFLFYKNHKNRNTISVSTVFTDFEKKKYVEKCKNTWDHFGSKKKKFATEMTFRFLCFKKKKKVIMFVS